MKCCEEILALNDSHLSMVDFKLAYTYLFAVEKLFIYKSFSQNLSHFLIQHWSMTTVPLYKNSYFSSVRTKRKSVLLLVK